MGAYPGKLTDNPPPGIEYRRVDPCETYPKGATIPTMLCSANSNHVLEFAHKGAKALPASVMHKMARQKGWQVSAKKGDHLCPDCKAKQQEARRAAKTPQPETPDMNRPVDASAMADALNTPQPLALPLTAKDRRTIFRRLDDVYDADNQRYKEGHTDRTVGERLNFPWEAVASVRDEMFGPPGPDPRIGALQDQIKAAEVSLASIGSTLKGAMAGIENLQALHDKEVERVKTAREMLDLIIEEAA